MGQRHGQRRRNRKEKQRMHRRRVCIGNFRSVFFFSPARAARNAENENDARMRHIVSYVGYRYISVRNARQMARATNRIINGEHIVSHDNCFWPLHRDRGVQRGSARTMEQRN